MSFFSPKTCPVCNRSFRGKTWKAIDGNICSSCYMELKQIAPESEWKDMPVLRLREILNPDVLAEVNPITRPDRPEKCPVCGGELPLWPWEIKDTFLCNDCYHKLQKILPQKQIEKLDLAQVTQALEAMEKGDVTTSCSVCGGDATEEGTILLTDFAKVCPSCVRKVRILYPITYTFPAQSLKKDFGMFSFEPDENEGMEEHDPVTSMTLPQFQKALEECDQERANRKAAYPTASAVFEVTDIAKWVTTVEREGRHKNKVEEVAYYEILGRVLLGKLAPGDTLRVAKEGGSPTKVTPLYFLPHNGAIRQQGKGVPFQVDHPAEGLIREGEAAVLVLSEEVPNLYPGDILIKRG